MPEYSRVVVFDADPGALEGLLNEITSSDGGPEGVPATGITVLANRASGKVVVAVRFASEDDLRTGAAKLETMSPPDASAMRRVSVDEYEIVLDRRVT